MIEELLFFTTTIIAKSLSHCHDTKPPKQKSMKNLQEIKKKIYASLIQENHIKEEEEECRKKSLSNTR